MAFGFALLLAFPLEVLAFRDALWSRLTPFSNHEGLSTRHYGIWDRSNAYSFPNGLNFELRGWASGLKWLEFEPKQGQFDYTSIDNVLAKAHRANASSYAMVSVGPDSPNWIYDFTPNVKTEKDDDHEGFDARGYPYYADAKYIELRNSMLFAFAKYLRNHPYAEAVGFVQANFGCTGDAILYKALPVDKKYRMTPAQQRQHMYDAYTVYKQAFQDGPGRVIPILVNLEDIEDEELWDFLLETFPAGGLGIKGSAFVRGHHLSGERTWIETQRSKLLNSTASSLVPFLFSRAEMDQTYSKCPVAKKNVQLYLYWGLINGLNQGLGVHDVSEGALAACMAVDCDSYAFFNKYAPQVWPMNSTRAFIALHQGLDAFDTKNFPEGKYGKANKNIDRVRAICRDYAQFGCRVDDEKAVLVGQVYQRDSQKGYNDVGYDIWRTNYGRWLEQIDEDLTSQGLFSVGGEITESTSKFARFARGLIHRLNKTGMYFRFSDGFFSVQEPTLLDMSVIYFDNVAGSFQVKYANQNGKTKVALDQTCVGDKTWKTATFTLTSMGSRLHDRNSDFSITSSARTDIIVHLIEAERALDG